MQVYGRKTAVLAVGFAAALDSMFGWRTNIRI